jgi:YfiH family protein
VGDDVENVACNIERLHAALGLDVWAMVTASQAQADRVAVVSGDHRGSRIVDVDALLTDQPGIPLMLRYADCVPILLFDPVHRAIGVVHAGWRGTVAHVAVKAARIMFDRYGTRPHDLIACIGPSIGPCCYVVREDVVDQVKTAFPEPDDLLMQRNGATHLDLWRANEQQLRDLGVEQIQVAALCTAEHTSDFYSARAEAKTGRFGAIIALV